MKKLKGILVLILLLALLASPIAVLASDISGARYYATIIVSNNSTATTNVAVNCTISTSALIDGGYLNSSANNCVVRSSAGADLPFMPAANATYPWCVWVPSIGENAATSAILYTANSTGGKIRYFPAADGMSTVDSASLELGDNFTIEQSGWVDTSYSVNKTLVYKEDAFVTYIASAENITSAILGIWSANLTQTLYVDGAGDYTNISDVVGAATHWEAVQDDPATDAQYVFEDTGPNTKWDSYSLEDSTVIGPHDSIDQVEVYVRGKIAAGPGTSLFSGGLRLGGVETDMPSSFNDMAWTTHNEVVARPGGGSWTLQNIQDLEVRVNSNHIDVNDPRDPYISQVYIVVTFRNPTMVSAPDISSGEHTVTTTANTLLLGVGIDIINADLPIANDLTLNAPLWHTELDSSPFTTKDVNEQSCTVTGATWSSTNGYRFDGTDDFITLDDPPVTTDNQGAISVWLNKDIATGLATFLCYVKEASASVDVLKIIVPADGSLRFIIYENGVNTANLNTPINVITLGDWHYVSFSSDGSTIKAYVDGIEVSLSASGGANNGQWFADLQTEPADTLIFGGYYRLNALVEDFAGYMGEFRVYGDVLTPAEILANYNATKWKYDGSSEYFYYQLVGAGVPNTANDWTFLQNLEDYWEYHTVSINGTQVQYIDWEYDDTTFSDNSTFGNDASPTFRTGTSDPDVTAVLTSFLPVAEARAPAYALEDAPPFIETVPEIVSEWDVTPQAGTFPLAGVIRAVAAATSTPAQLPLLVVAAFVILAISLTVSSTMRKYGSGSLIVKILTITAVMGVFIAFKNFGVEFWMLFVFLVIAIALAMGSKQVGWQ